MLRAPNDVPVLVDFGLASAGEGAGLTKTGRSAGHTPMFAAPEQLRGKSADARSDIYCLAATIYYALNYHQPEHREPDRFEEDSVPEALRGPCVARESAAAAASAGVQAARERRAPLRRDSASAPIATPGHSDCAPAGQAATQGRRCPHQLARHEVRRDSARHVPDGQSGE